MIETRVEDIIDSLQPIAAEIGVETVISLSRHFGGARLYIPTKWHAGLDFNVIGEAQAQRLCQLFGPERIDIPRMPYTRSALQRYANALRRSDSSNSDIARALGLSWRTVARLATAAPLTGKRRRALDDRQIDIEEFLAAAKPKT